MKNGKWWQGVLVAAVLAATVVPCAPAAITLLDGVPWLYEVKAGKAIILHGPGCGDLAIPSRIDGYPVQGIGARAFSDCSGLTSVEIPDGVIRIGDHAFHGCSGLKEVMLPAGMPYVGNGVFEYCSNLTDISIPDSVTVIQDSAFYECGELRSVTIPGSVTIIGAVAFCGCDRLAEVTIPDSVKTIGDYAFGGCFRLAEVTVGRGVTSIGKGAFVHCNGLKTLHMPSWWETKLVDGEPWSVHASAPAECEIVYYKAEEPPKEKPVMPTP